jgi:hypothetical protein
MKLYCAFCDRPMLHPAVLIGNYPVGPKCAKRAGLLELANRKSGIVVPVVKRKPERPDYPQTMSLFEEAA